MAQPRIEARLGPCRACGWASLDRYVLRYHKPGRDGSGKCDAHFTGAPADRMYGALFELSVAQARALDGYEGPGDTRQDVQVQTQDGPTTAYAYVALPDSVIPRLRPYPWYHAFVVEGAKSARLPATYLAYLATIETTADPDKARQRENDDILKG
ncbi:MAG: gamma-glutamylcyclotransferase [Gammaproteobacteria bacterium]|jgi:gamma-glutamylcyclotransferase